MARRTLEFEQMLDKMKAQHQRQRDEDTNAWELKLMVAQDNLRMEFESQIESLQKNQS